ncbi:enoyl-CoA hydratase-related protein [Nocardia rhizosphaerihabitans]|uniref:Enoyl-CoA hydratase n=1 Tax=Nocardia rhizosphaerihabitans TaxID=1691570 RepID=A0ABQ2L2W7_9NOCA|nr:enoyl-CoA hydratase-related protein [Nocardia rhizosphaerihabitans]GGO00789.1 enoyl-CoA hydratase [Nocardia rhizosphaerihabitans]
MSLIVETTESGVRVLTINRSAKRNALDIQMYRALAAGVVAAERDPEVDVTVVTGHGGRFTSGNDLADFRDDPDSRAAFDLLHSLVEAEKPIIAAVEGVAVGIGASMLLHCDLAFAGRSTVFSLPFVKLGLTPEGASTLLLSRIAGYKTASELLLLGDNFDADRAERAGLVNRVVPDGDALTAALDAAAALRALPAESVRLTKRLLHRDKVEVLRVIDEEAEHFIERCHSADAKAAIARFLG